MKLTVVFPLFVFISCSLWAGKADICGGNKIAKTITVGRAGTFKTVQAAIDSVQNYSNAWVKIHIYAGIYVEKVEIPNEKPCIFLEGEGRAVTTITNNDHQQTDTSSTFTSRPPNVVVKGITFRNSFNLLSGGSYLRGRGPANEVKQALAARIYGDRSAFYECGFVGYQDTLWDAVGRHYFYKCYIAGSIDFIFGYGQSYYEDCVMNVTLSTRSAQVPWGCVTAQGRKSQADGSGFVFVGGSVVGKGQATLGRAYGPYSRVIFHGTYLDSVVAPQGWDAWNYKGQEGNIEYAEVNCEGPGAHKRKRVPWEKNLGYSELRQFSIKSFIDQDRWLASVP